MHSFAFFFISVFNRILSQIIFIVILIIYSQDKSQLRTTKLSIYILIFLKALFIDF